MIGRIKRVVHEEVYPGTSDFVVSLVHGTKRAAELVDRSFRVTFDNHLARGLFALDHVGEDFSAEDFKKVHGALEELWNESDPKLRADYEARADRLTRLMMALKQW